MRKIIVIIVFAFPFAVSAQYYGYDSAAESRRIMERQLDMAEQQRMHNEAMLMEQQRQQQMQQMMQQQRLDNMNNSNNGFRGFQPAGF